jgi:hypothetical protein
MVLVLSSITLSPTGNSGSSLSTSAAGGVSMGAGSSCMREMSVSWELRRLTGGASRLMVAGGLGERGAEDGDDEFDARPRRFRIDLSAIGEVIVGRAFGSLWTAHR